MISDFRDISSEESSPLIQSSITAQTPELLKHRQHFENNLIEDDRPVWTQISRVTAIIDSINDDINADKYKGGIVSEINPNHNMITEEYIGTSNLVLPIDTYDANGIIDLHNNEIMTQTYLNSENYTNDSDSVLSNFQHIHVDQQPSIINPLHIDIQTSSISPFHVKNDSLYISNEETESVFSHNIVSELDIVDKKKYSSIWKASNLNMKQNYIELIESLIIYFRSRSNHGFGLINELVELFNKKEFQVCHIESRRSLTTNTTSKHYINILSLIWSMIVIFNSLLYAILYFQLNKLAKISIWIFESCIWVLILLPWITIEKLASIFMKNTSVHLH